MKKLIKKHFSNFYWFFTYLRYKILIGVVLSILVGVMDGLGLTMFLPLLQMVNGEETANTDSGEGVGYVLNIIEVVGLPLNLSVVLLFLLLFFVLKGVAKFSSEVYRVALQQELIRKIRFQLLHRLNKVDFKYFVTTDAGRIQNTMTGEVDRIQRAYISYFVAIEQLVLVGVYMTFAFLIDAQFALLVTIGGALTNFLYKAVYKYTKGASKKLTTDSNIYQGRVIQHVGNFKYLRATGMVDSFAARLENIIKKIEESRKKIGVLGGLLAAAREPMMIAVVVAVIAIQVQVLNGSLGAILISLLFFYRALTALTSVQDAWNGFLGVSGSLDNLQSFQNDLQQNQLNNGTNGFEGLKHKIEAQNVSFQYGKTLILSNISLLINNNTTVAFVGESGSGKTTMVNVLCGLLPLDKGKVLVDDMPISDMDRTSYQKRIGYITQEPVIFNDSIFNNVSFWAERNAENIARCRMALEKAAVWSFVESLTEGIDTQLGNNGINLSGGQKQRISIARELYKDVDILIMDEATSALDSETERVIQDNIESLKGKYTILIVAHRLSTIKNADEIVLMEKGSITSKGTFDELLTKRPNFRRMVELQEV